MNAIRSIILVTFLFPSRNWIWGGVGYLFGSCIIFTILSGFALQRMSPSITARVADQEAVANARREAAERKRAQVGEA